MCANAKAHNTRTVVCVSIATFHKYTTHIFFLKEADAIISKNTAALLGHRGTIRRFLPPLDPKAVRCVVPYSGGTV